MTPAELPPSLHIDAARARVRLSPADPAFVQDPYPAYRAIRRSCPLFLWEDYGHLCAADAATVDALFRDRRFGREAPGRPPPPERVKPFHDLDALSMLEREPPAHTRLRRLVTRAFVFRAVERLRPRIERVADALLDALPDRGTVDLLPAYAEPIPVVVIAELLGVPAADAPHLLDWSHRMVAMYRPGRTRADEDAAVAATLAFSAYLRDHLAERRARPREDLLTLLATAPEGEITPDEAVANAALLLNAGHEATVHAIGNAVAAVLGSGLDPAALFATPALTAATVEEALRFEPPLHLFTRTCLEPARVAGTAFRPGDRVGLLIGAANRDPARWAAPDGFDPARAPAPHLGFGGGIHFCLGAPLARLELEVALPRLFARRTGLRSADAPRFADRYHFRGLDALRVTLG